MDDQEGEGIAHLNVRHRPRRRVLVPSKGKPKWYSLQKRSFSSEDASLSHLSTLSRPTSCTAPFASSAFTEEGALRNRQQWKDKKHIFECKEQKPTLKGRPEHESNMSSLSSMSNLSTSVSVLTWTRAFAACLYYWL